METPQIVDLYAFPETDRPWLRANFVSTIDGAAYGLEGKTGSLGGEADHDVFTMQRNLCDVVLVGAGTTRTEGYRAITAKTVDGEVRRSLGLAPVPVLAVVSHSLRLPASLNVAGTIVITTQHDLAAHGGLLADGVSTIVAGASKIDWPSAFATLGDRGLRKINCEGGPTLHGDLVASDLVDEICLTIDPSLAAGSAPRISHSPSAVHRTMRVAHVRQVGDVVLTRYLRA